MSLHRENIRWLLFIKQIDLAWWIWGGARIYFLIGVRNRLAVALNWLWLASGARSTRLITQTEQWQKPVR